jgi:hypothetical protein
MELSFDCASGSLESSDRSINAFRSAQEEEEEEREEKRGGRRNYRHTLQHTSLPRARITEAVRLSSLFPYRM